MQLYVFKCVKKKLLVNQQIKPQKGNLSHVLRNININQGHKDHKLSIRKAVVHCCCSGLNE